MNIALITDNYLPKTGGITTDLLNFREKLTNLGEKILVFNNTYTDPKDLCFNILYSKYKFKDLISQKINFYLFDVQLFLRILLQLKDIKIIDKLKLAFYFCFYPKYLVNKIKSIRNLVNYFKKYKIDIILSASTTYPLFYSFLISKWFKIPLITLAHGVDFIKRYPLDINIIILNNIEKIIFSNIIMLRFFQKIYKTNDKKLVVANRGINIEKVEVIESKQELRKIFNISDHDFIILSVTRLHYRKGIDSVIRAVNLIVKENINIPLKYFIIGKGFEEEKLKDLVKELNLDEYITFLENVDDKLRNRYYKLSDMFVLVPILKKDSIEGFGIVYIEANYFNIPVVGSLTGGIKAAIIPNYTGFLIKPNDIEDLKEKILLLYNNEKLRNELGYNGHQRIIKEFNWNNIAYVYQKIFKDTIREYASKM